MNKERLCKLDEVLHEMISTGYAAGVNCLVIHKGKEQCYFEAGFRDRGNNLPITRDTIFRLYSMTKPITSAAVMILLQDGRIDLNEPVSKYISSFANQKYVDADGNICDLEKPVTIQQLLNMTSGVSYPGDSNISDRAVEVVCQDALNKLYTEDELSTKELIDKIAKCPLAFKPGTIWSYGFSADVLGLLVENVSGMKFSEFLKKNIFEPLEMVDTDFYVPEDKQTRLSKTYEEYNGELILYTGDNLVIQNRMERKPLFESGGAGLNSTIDDYAHFNQMLMDGGSYKKRRILYKSTVDFMTKSHLTNDQQKGVETWDHMGGYSYGNLLRVMKNPGLACSVSSKGEYGWDGWLGAYMMNDPKNDLTFLMMQQKKDTGTTEYTRRLRNILFSAL